MTKAEARLIREVKKRSTWRYLAEVYYAKNHPLHGNQLAGQDLCARAFKILYPKLNRNELFFKGHSLFDQINQSKVGQFYWWE